MIRRARLPGLFAAVLCGALAGSSAPPGEEPAARSDLPVVEQDRTVAAVRRMPVTFVENRGQVRGEAAYYAIGGGASVEFAPGGLRYAPVAPPEPEDVSGANAVLDRRLSRPDHEGLRLDFVGANPVSVPVGVDPLGTRVHSFTGAPDRWRSDLRTYERIVYRELWPGIDAVFFGGAGRLKHEFVVRPGADPSRIRLRWRGASSVRLDAAGAMVVEAPATALRDERPYAYQDVGDARREVESAYELGGQEENGTDYGFRLGPYDASRPLVVDPVQFAYVTYVGTSYHDRGLGVAVDAKGAAYVTGRIASTATMSYDAYVVKVAPDGASFVYVAFIGGEGVDEGFDIAVDGEGAAYVVGPAGSSDFPTPGGADTTFGGGQCDAYVAKLSPAGDRLVFATFLGGARTDFAEGVAVDGEGNVYVEGPTDSTEETFAVRVGPDLTHNGGWDLFVAKVAADGSRFAYAGFVGGDAVDVGADENGITSGHVAVDRHGAAYLSGMTTSTEATFPGGKGFGDLPSFDRTHNGAVDAFAVKVKPDGTGLAWAGYIGGDADDKGFGMAVDSKGNAYLTGSVESAEATFPTGKGFGDLPGLDKTYGGAVDAFLAEIQADGTRLLWASYVGGPKLDYGQSVALDPAGDLWVVGHVESPDFTVLEGPDLTFNGPSTDGDAFVARWKPDGTKILSCGFIGGAGDDHAYWVAIDSAGNVYVAGDTPSSEATFPDGDGMAARSGVLKKHHGGTADAFLVKITR